MPDNGDSFSQRAGVPHLQIFPPNRQEPAIGESQSIIVTNLKGVQKIVSSNLTALTI